MTKSISSKGALRIAVVAVYLLATTLGLAHVPPVVAGTGESSKDWLEICTGTGIVLVRVSSAEHGPAESPASQPSGPSQPGCPWCVAAAAISLALVASSPAIDCSSRAVTVVPRAFGPAELHAAIDCERPEARAPPIVL